MPTVQTQSIRIHYAEAGKGEPLLCIMGITAPGSVWEAHVAEWSKHYRCIMPDNRGVGLSDKPAENYTSAMMADDYASLMDELGIKTAKVIGCSMGSIIAQQLMIRHPDKVESAVLMCSWARCDNQAKAIFSHMETCKSRFLPSEFTHYIHHLIFSKQFLDNEDNIESLRDGEEGSNSDANPQPLVGLMGQSHACKTHDTFDLLPQIHSPCLVIGGEDDQFTPLWMSMEVANQIQKSETFFYKGRGHAFHFEEIEDFNQRILKWLSTSK